MLCLPWAYLTHAVLYFANNCHTLSLSICISGLAGHFDGFSEVEVLALSVVALGKCIVWKVGAFLE